MLVVCTEKKFEERRQLLHNKMAVVSQGHFPKDHLANCFKYVLQLIQNETSHLRLTNDTNVSFERSYIFESYSGKDLEPEESGGAYTIRINFKIHWIFLKEGGLLINYPLYIPINSNYELFCYELLFSKNNCINVRCLRFKRGTI